MDLEKYNMQPTSQFTDMWRVWQQGAPLSHGDLLDDTFIDSAVEAHMQVATSLPSSPPSSPQSDRKRKTRFGVKDSNKFKRCNSKDPRIPVIPLSRKNHS